MPPKPRWLLALPDAIRQLEALDRELLTRRDIERLFGVSKVRAAQLMATFGAGRTGHILTLPRAALLRQLRRHRKRAAFRGEEARRDRVVTEIRKARLTGIRVAVPVEALEARLSGLPAGVSVEPGRIEVRFSGAKDAVGRLFALAQALTNDYEQFEALVDGATPGAAGERCGNERRRRAGRADGRPAPAASTARLVSVMLYSFARVSAVIAMRRQDYFRQERRGWLRLHEKGGTRHDVPAHHRAAEAKAALFQSVDPAGRRLTGRALSRRLVLAMIKRRAAPPDLPLSTCCHTFRATGITAYLSNGGTLEHAQQIAGHASPKATKLYDRTADTITVDEIERIVI